MRPHFFGYVPYALAWFPVIFSFYVQIADLCKRLEKLMPSWVPLIIAGCFGIFSCFAVVQLVYQWLPPRRYWETELWYCFLSLTAKSFLGFTLYINVLSKASFNEAIAIEGHNFTLAFNETAFCLGIENFTSVRD
jgi:uncharacterized membrane protein